MDRWMDGRVEGWMERWIDMGMDEWMGRSMEGHTATGRACTFRWSQVLSPPRQFNVMSKTIWLGRQSPAQEASFDRLMPDMLALLQSVEHPGSRQKADS